MCIRDRKGKTGGLEVESIETEKRTADQPSKDTDPSLGFQSPKNRRVQEQLEENKKKSQTKQTATTEGEDEDNSNDGMADLPMGNDDALTDSESSLDRVPWIRLKALR